MQEARDRLGLMQEDRQTWDRLTGLIQEASDRLGLMQEARDRLGLMQEAREQTGVNAGGQ